MSVEEQQQTETPEEVVVPQDQDEAEPAEPTDSQPPVQKRIAQLTAKYREEERKRQRLEEALAQLRGAKPSAATESPVNPENLNQAILEEEIQKRAEAIAAQQFQRLEQAKRAQELNSASNAVAAKGKAKYKDFDDAIPTLNAFVPLAERPDVLEALISLPNAEDVIYKLGNDPDEAAKLSLQNPAKLGMQLANLSAQLAQKPAKGSSAPAPIKPVGSTGGTSRSLRDDMPLKDWLAAREETIRKR